MKIPIILNEEKTFVEAESDESLLTVLRRAGLLSVKCGCQKGVCGNCMVLLNDQVVKSCKVPVAIVRDCKIETLEHFKQNPDYETIMEGFKKAGIELCGYCNSAKIFTAYSVLYQKLDPDLSKDFHIQEAIKNLHPCCCDKSTLLSGIVFAVNAKKSKGDLNNGKSNRRKR